MQLWVGIKPTVGLLAGVLEELATTMLMDGHEFRTQSSADGLRAGVLEELACVVQCLAGALPLHPAWGLAHSLGQHLGRLQLCRALVSSPVSGSFHTCGALVSPAIRSWSETVVDPYTKMLGIALLVAGLYASICPACGVPGLSMLALTSK